MKRIDYKTENNIIKMYLEGYSCRDISEEYKVICDNTEITNYIT